MIKINGFNETYSGLSNKEVRNLQYKYGKNELKPAKKAGFLTRVLTIFKEPMFLLLFCTASIYFILGEISDGILMLVFVFFIFGINNYQEWKTEKTLQALKDLSTPKVRVIRNNIVENIDSIELTVHDLMIFEEGEKVPADGRIIEMYDLGIDESSLTGESKVVWKTHKPDIEKNNYWQKNCCYAGTTVVQGRAIVEVTSIGSKTEYGKIGTDILSVPHQSTILEKEIRKLINICAVIGFILFILVLCITYLNSKDVIKSILAGITLAMAMIPEEFPVILTIFLAMGAWRLAKKNALIRKIPAVEILGSVSVLCVDKTGTLTKNQMTVQELYSYKDVKPEDLIYWAALACEPEPFDPMEKAILDYAVSKGVNKKLIFDNQLVFEYPFSIESKMMGHVWQIDGKKSLTAKGSLESIIPLCYLNIEETKLLESQQELLAQKGYRVIAVAVDKGIGLIPDELKQNKLEFLGIIALMDPPRESVPGAIAVCSKAGIRVVVITGDNGVTAKSIAQKIGISNCENVITGKELDAMDDGELQNKLKFTNIFARVIPSHKMRIVQALKSSGEIVAMTGDGVNDAPALKLADIGISMGKRGTNVAKEASDMILLDDNFATIVNAIKDGRRIYDNIKKAIGYVFVIHIPIALIALLTPLLDLPLFLLPIHVVLLQLIIDPTCSIVFERNPAEKDIMNRKPRSPKESLINESLLIKAILQGLAIFAVTFGAYWYFYLQTKMSLLAKGVNVDKLLLTLKGVELQNFMIILTGSARTIALLTFVLSNLFLVYINQSENEYAFSNIIKSRDAVKWYINIAILAAMALVIYTPYGNTFVQTHRLDFYEILLTLGLAFMSTFWWEFIKLFKLCLITKQNTQQ